MSENPRQERDLETQDLKEKPDTSSD